MSSFTTSVRRSPQRARLWRYACLILLSGACVGEIAAPETEGVAEPDVASALDQAALTRTDALALRSGTREVLVQGIVAAENQLFSTSDRLYVSGDNGVFELTRAAGGAVTASVLVAESNCKFGGMAERAATLYAVCYDNMQSQLYAARETTHPSFTRIFSLEDISVGNGMATDGSNLYITATGQGMIVRLALDPADPLRVLARSSLMDDTGGVLPNGIKIQDGFVYWGDFGSVRRTSLRAPDPFDVQISALTFFDDFCLSDQGVLIADFLFGTVRHYGANGVLQGSTRGVFNGPSSVAEAQGRLGFGTRDLIVTEKGADTVSVFHY